MMDVLLKPGDVFLTRGTGLLSRAIRVCTRSFGEKRSKVNHVGVVVEEGGIQTAVVVEALIKVRKHRLWQQYGPPKKDHVAVYRAKSLKPEEIEIIVAEANEQVGRPYGFGKIIAHFLDWLLTGAYVFRRLTSDPRYPICSWLVAHSYSKAGKDFGVAPGAADPDDIWPFEPVRDVLDRPELEDIREGFRTGAINKRGVTSRAPGEGGSQERSLATNYRHYANALRTSHQSPDHGDLRPDAARHRHRRTLPNPVLYRCKTTMPFHPHWKLNSLP